MKSSRTHTLISLEDMYGYIQIKSEEDYTYNDAIMMLNTKQYDKVPYNFLVFLGRMLESTITRIYPREDVGEEVFEKSTYEIDSYDNHVIRVRYLSGEDITILHYVTDYVVTDLGEQELNDFVDVYMERTLERIMKIDSMGFAQNTCAYMFHRLRWVALYIEDKTGKIWVDEVNARVNYFLNKLKDYEEVKGKEYIEELGKYIKLHFREIKIDSEGY